MKLLITLIITILLNIANCQNCFIENQFSGATTEFISSDINCNVQSSTGLFQYSGVTNGTVSIDLQKGMVYINSDELTVSFGQTYFSSSQIYGFESTSNMYVVNEGVCYTTVLSFPIPINQIPQLNNIGTSTIGTLECTLYEVVNPRSSSYTTTNILVNEEDCSIVSGQSFNTNGTPGGSIINFYNYIPKPNPSLFQIPSICNNAKPLPTINESHMRTISRSLSILKNFF